MDVLSFCASRSIEPGLRARSTASRKRFSGKNPIEESEPIVVSLQASEKHPKPVVSTRFGWISGQFSPTRRRRGKKIASYATAGNGGWSRETAEAAPAEAAAAVRCASSPILISSWRAPNDLLSPRIFLEPLRIVIIPR